ncbi:MAG: thioredoxin [archaeon]
MSIVHLDGENFQREVEKSAKSVIVDFWAEWCGPCRMMGPVFEKLSGEFSGKLKFAKLETDSNQEIAGRYGIMSIPTLLVFKGGKPHAKLVGFRPEAALRKDIEGLLKDIEE